MQPVEDRREISSLDAKIQIRRMGPNLAKPLRRVHRTQRVARKISEQAGAPMDVLQTSVGRVVARVDAEQQGHAVIPELPDVLGLDLTIDQALFDLSI